MEDLQRTANFMQGTAESILSVRQEELGEDHQSCD